MAPYTVLVTGSSGHLGTALILSLPSLGHVPLGIDILPSPTTSITGSITDLPLLLSILTSHPTITHIIHAATLHKPHVASHPAPSFIETNISGTQALLDAAASILPRIKSFIFISTTSTFGSALSPSPGSPASWIDESVTPIPKNIYGVTKTSAEDLCRLAHVQTSLPVVVLRTSRFFPESDDDPARRAALHDANLKVCELAHRRVDIADVVSAVVCATDRARDIGWGKYVISAPTPFARDEETLRRLGTGDAASMLREAVPGCEAVFEKLGWGMMDRVDRVYDSSLAVKELGWKPEWTMEKVVEKLARDEDWRSELTHRVGKKGYHAAPTGVYTTEARSA
ncbi:NAD-dependent epimerase dehydratase [Colletotrichum musicola]|uniref:NAD-dependent epimerase dehydratase n=1 Tax=Colletotrichum musicola TaxID=2175873 RepID=A0A8H6KD22_9PEZI|nr:NAD-dependent epimerase dehydratase [Colletotrichum musicola]